MNDTLVKIADIAKVITKGTTPTTLGYEFQDIGVNFLKIECFDENGNFIPDKVAHISEECNDKLKRSQLESGDVLFSIAGAIGRVAIVTEEMLPANTNQALAIIRIKDDSIYLPYIKLILTSNIVNEQIERKKQGVAQLNLSLKDIGEIEIPMPVLEKQKKIVKLFEKIESIIRNRKLELYSLDALIKSRFVEMFGTPLVNEKKWYIKSAGDICTVTDGSHFSPVGVEQGYPMLSVKNMRNDGFHYEGCKRVSQDDYELLVKQGCKPLKNDVLISKDGSYFYYGFVVKDEIEQAVLSSIAILRPNIEEVNPEYLCRYMLSNAIVDLIGKNYVTGAAIKRVILKGIKQIPVMLPPIELQEEFSDFIHQVDKLKFEVQKSVEETQQLMDSLMQKYFG